jgi:lipoprotein NlpD
MQEARGNRQDNWGNRPDFILLLASNLLLLVMTSCSIYAGVYHTVENGQTLWRITKAYDSNIQEVAELNDISDPTQIRAGQRIFIPGAWRRVKIEPYLPAGDDKKNGSGKTGAGKTAYRAEEPEVRIILEKWRFAWQVKGTVISSFGMRDGKKHDGIDIAALEGSPVSAAQKGEVIYSNNGIRGYGNIVMLKHTEGFITVYAHNKENLVKVGEMVEKGDIIAALGGAGNASVPHLHFEIRKDRRPRNPLFFLP